MGSPAADDTPAGIVERRVWLDFFELDLVRVRLDSFPPEIEFFDNCCLLLFGLLLRLDPRSALFTLLRDGDFLLFVRFSRRDDPEELSSWLLVLLPVFELFLDLDAVLVPRLSPSRFATGIDSLLLDLSALP